MIRSITCILIPSAESVGNNKTVTEPSIIIVDISKEYSTKYANLTCSQSQSFLKMIRKENNAITYSTPPNNLGWKVSEGPSTGSIISRKKIARAPYNIQTTPYAKSDIFVIFWISVISYNQLPFL
jgi:hypothetical protein